MDAKLATTIKVLADLGIHKEEKLSDEEQLMLDRALDPDLDFDCKTIELFSKKTDK